MHLHMHLKECLQDFGPVYSFWCFGFERFNGVLGLYHTNSRDIGLVMMRKFVNEAQVLSLDHDQHYTHINIKPDVVSNYEDSVKPMSVPVRVVLSDHKPQDIHSL